MCEAVQLKERRREKGNEVGITERGFMVEKYISKIEFIQTKESERKRTLSLNT
jgi:hypothetical protein